jgi:hypothetical protein
MALAAGAVVLAVVALALISILTSEGAIEPNLGDEEYTHRADRLAAEIDDRGPFILPDASPRKDRDVYIQHLGDDPEKGWYAFDARPDDQPDRECSARWTGSEFEDPCTGETFPPDGEGLTQYPVRVEDGVVHVRFRPEEE